MSATQPSSQEPRLAVTKNSDSTSQVFGTDVQLGGADPGFFAESTWGYPVEKPNTIPDGEYTVQGVYLPYELYNRSDGHAVWLPSFDATTYSHDQDDYGWTDPTKQPVYGQNGALTAPGSFYSAPQVVTFRAGKTNATLSLHQQATPRPPAPPESEYMKRITVRSKLLSAFWNREVNLSAWLLLPFGYNDPQHRNVRYPLMINQGHYSDAAFRGWADEPPRKVLVVPPSVISDKYIVNASHVIQTQLPMYLIDR